MWHSVGWPRSLRRSLFAIFLNFWFGAERRTLGLRHRRCRRRGDLCPNDPSPKIQKSMRANIQHNRLKQEKVTAGCILPKILKFYNFTRSFSHVEAPLDPASMFFRIPSTGSTCPPTTFKFGYMSVLSAKNWRNSGELLNASRNGSEGIWAYATMISWQQCTSCKSIYIYS